MLTNSKIALSVTLVLATASAAVAAPKLWACAGRPTRYARWSWILFVRSAQVFVTVARSHDFGSRFFARSHGSFFDANAWAQARRTTRTRLLILDRQILDSDVAGIFEPLAKSVKSRD